MEKSKLIIVEGPQGVGKTTITDYIRDTLKHTNLYRLNGISDSTVSGLEKSKRMYENHLEYLKKMENNNINLLFDRTFFSEENYCRLGFKEYDFTEPYNSLVDSLANLDFEIYYITLFLSDEKQYENRLNRDEKDGPNYAKYKAQNSINQQKVYLEMSKEIEEKNTKIKVINLDTNKNFEIIKKEIREILQY